jgi:hypothetical protein
MAQFQGFQNLHFARLGIAPWKLALAAVATVALGLAVLVIATGVFLVVVPVIAVAALATRLFAARPPQPREHPAGQGPLIEGEYRVLSSRPVPRRDWSAEPDA